MIRMHFPWLPPSSNHAYENVTAIVRGKAIGGGRRLSAEGKKFKTETKVYLARHFGSELAQVKLNEPYVLHLVLFSNKLLNKTFPSKTKIRYKKFDASNRVKLIEDVIADICGIDDSQFLCIIAAKQEAEGNERTLVTLHSLNDPETGINLFEG